VETIFIVRPPIADCTPTGLTTCYCKQKSYPALNLCHETASEGAGSSRLGSIQHPHGELGWVKTQPWKLFPLLNSGCNSFQPSSGKFYVQCLLRSLTLSPREDPRRRSRPSPRVHEDRLAAQTRARRRARDEGLRAEVRARRRPRALGYGRAAAR